MAILHVQHQVKGRPGGWKCDRGIHKFDTTLTGYHNADQRLKVWQSVQLIALLHRPLIVAMWFEV